MTIPENNRLVRQAAQGSKKAMEQLCHEYGRSVLFACVKLMGSLADGEDAAQEVFIKMHQSIKGLKSPEAFKVWLHRLVVNTCNTMRRKNMNKPDYFPVEELAGRLPETDYEVLPEEYVTQVEHRAELLAIVDRLPAGMRTCMLYYYWEGMKIAEIARVTGSSEDSVKAQLYNGRRRIREAIESKDSSKYNHALLPMSALAGLLRQQEQTLITPQMVQSSLAMATKGLAAAKAASAGLAVKLASLAAAATIATTAAVGVVYTHTSSRQGLPTAAYHPQGTSQAVSSRFEDSPPAQGDLPAGKSEKAGKPESQRVPQPSGAPLPASSGPPAEDPAGPASSQASGTSSQPGASPPQPSPLPTADIQGRVRVEGLTDQEAQKGSPYFAGMMVYFQNAAGIPLGRTRVGAKGTFVLPGVPADPSGSIIATLELANQDSFSFSAHNPEGKLTLTPQSGAAPLAFLVRDITAPTLALTLADAAGQPTMVNPARAEIWASDNLTVQCRWELWEQGAKEPLRSGSSTTLTKPLAALAGRTGHYVLKAWAEDAAGNQSTQEETFLIL